MILKSKANGIGEFHHVDGYYYSGEWKNDKAYGKGKYLHESV